jgi:hypothetical protein
MKDQPKDEILFMRTGKFKMTGIAFASHIVFTAQTSCILEQTQFFSCCPNCATIQYGYQRLAVETAHATDVIIWTMHHCSLGDAVSSAKGGYQLQSR